MPRFRKKPLEIDAFQMTEAARWNNEDWPSWLNFAWNADPGEGAVWTDPDDRAGSKLVIGTFEGVYRVSWDDWIVRGVQGEIYAIKPDIFEVTYEPAGKSAREKLAEGRDHLTVSGAFQSDKYIWCPAGFVPLKLRDPGARDLLAEYARRRGIIDGEFARDLFEALRNTPEKENAGYGSFEKIEGGEEDA